MIGGECPECDSDWKVVITTVEKESTKYNCLLGREKKGNSLASYMNGGQLTSKRFKGILADSDRVC
jgi:hypothetical protein